MNILITGGAGSIGSALAEGLARNRGNEIYIVDDLSTGALWKIPTHANVHFIRANVNDYEDMAPIFCTHGFHYVFHYAATVGVKRTLAHPFWVFDDIDGIKHICKLSKNTGVRRLFFSSSSEVYGEPFEVPQNEETTPLNSRLPYAIVKNLAESYIKAYQAKYGLNYTIFRFFNTYGPKQTEDFVLPRFLSCALQGKPLPVYGKGQQTRTFCYIDDNVEATIKTLYDSAFKNSVVNIGNNREIKIIDLAKTIIKLTNSSSSIDYRPPLKEGDMTRRCPDISQMQSILGRKLIQVEEGIQKLINYYAHRNQPSQTGKPVII